MSLLRERITLVLTGMVYLLFHLRLGATPQEIVIETAYQLLLTAPYAIGFTLMIVAFIRTVSGGTIPPWDRLLRIFFTLGILFGLFFALYEYGGGQVDTVGVSRVSGAVPGPDDNHCEPWHWA
jgi:hypothetical protein